MKIEIKKPGSAAFEPLDLPLAEVAEQLRAGAAISATLPRQPAEFVAVAVPILTSSAAQFVSHAFTKAHACVIANDGRLLLLVFQLPSPIANEKLYRLVQQGLAAKYCGAVTIRTVNQAFGCSAGAFVEVMPGVLTGGAFEELADAGKGQLALRRGEGYWVSSMCVEGNDVFDSEHGHDLPLERVPDGERLRCPFHIGGAVSAEVLTLETGDRALACHDCKRLFGPRQRVRRYDFGEFERVVRGLAVGAGENVSKMSARYLPSGLVQGEGAWLIKSPKGSGKTELLKDVIADARAGIFDDAIQATSGRVLLIGHRRTLLYSMAKRLDLDCYLTPTSDFVDTPSPGPVVKASLLDTGEVEDGDTSSEDEEREVGGMTRVKPTSCYAVCVDSLPLLKPNKHQYPVVLIDECEQVFAHLVGATLKDRRREVYKLMEHYLRVAKVVVLLDADLGLITMRAVCGMNLRPETKMHIVINTPWQATGELKLYHDAGQLVEELKRAVRSGKKTFVAVNAKQKAKELERALSELHPGKRIVAVHADNAQNPDVQRLLKNLPAEFENNLDVLIASPALATGVDISFYDANGKPRTVVEQVFGLFKNNITTHFEIDQHLFRVRHPKEVHVWVDRTEMNYEPDPAAIRVELRETVARDSVLVGYKDDGTPVLSDDALLDIWTETKAVQRGSKNILREAFVSLRRQNRSEVQPVGLDQDANEAGKKTLREARQQRIEAEAVCVSEAEDLDDEELETLQRRLDEGLPVSEAEQWAMLKARLEKFYKTAADAELVKFDEGGATRRAILNLELTLTATAQDAATREADAAAYKRRKREGDGKPASTGGLAVAFDRPMLASKREVLRMLLGAAGLFNHATNAFNTERLVSHGSLTAFVQAVDKERRRLAILFDLAVRADYVKKPMQQLGQILALVGLGMKQAAVTDAAGAKVREYQLDAARLEVLFEVIQRRQEAAAGQGAEAAKPSATRTGGLSQATLAITQGW